MVIGVRRLGWFGVPREFKMRKITAAGDGEAASRRNDRKATARTGARCASEKQVLPPSAMLRVGMTIRKTKTTAKARARAKEEADSLRE